ncbi:DNA polymerase III subunit delta [Oscillospiraceae bacterium 38-13]
MVDTKKTSSRGSALQKLKTDLKTGRPASAYIFYGEESYLREYYLGELRKKLIPPGSETFNSHRLEGKELTAQTLAEAVEAMPMLAERTLISVIDWDIFKLGENQREKLIALLEDLPPYCCVVFVYDTLEYKPNKTMKKLCKALDAYVEAVEFQAASSAELLPWIARRFKALGKEIDRNTAEYLAFVCGGLMTGLVPEIEKIAAYAKGPSITRKDVDAVADPVLSAKVFKLSDEVIQGNYDKAASTLGDLLKMQTEPIVILAALGSQLRRIWTARLALDSGRDRLWLMDLWGLRSNFQVNQLFDAARRTSGEWCAGAVRQCQILDRRMKSERGVNNGDELKLLLVRLAAERR